MIGAFPVVGELFNESAIKVIPECPSIVENA